MKIGPPPDSTFPNIWEWLICPKSMVFSKILQIGRDILKPNFQWRKPLNCWFSIFVFLMASGVITKSLFCFRFLMVKATILKSLMRSCVIAHPGRPEQLKPVSSAVMLQIQPPSKSFIKVKGNKKKSQISKSPCTNWYHLMIHNLVTHSLADWIFFLFTTHLMSHAQYTWSSFFWINIEILIFKILTKLQLQYLD